MVVIYILYILEMMTVVLAWLCDNDLSPIDDLSIKTLEVDKSIIGEDGYFEFSNEKYLYYGDHK